MAASFLETIKEVERRLPNTQRGKHVVLNPPADPSGLVLLSAALGRAPSEELRTWLLAHDGESGAIGALGDGIHLFSGREIASEYLLLLGDEETDQTNQHVVCDGPVRPQLFNRRWVPVAQFYDELAFIDEVPLSGGHPGQIIMVDRVNLRNWVAFPSFAALFDAFASCLRDGDDRLRFRKSRSAQ